MDQLAILIVLVVILRAAVGGRSQERQQDFITRWAQQVLGRLTSCLLTVVVLVVVAQMIRVEVGRWWANHFGPTPAPQTAPSGPEPSPEPIRFDYPVGGPEDRPSGEGWQVTQDFEDVRNAYNTSREGQHLGEDWALTGGRSGGQPVYAVADGVVLLSGPARSYGHVVVIKHSLAAGADPPYVVSMSGHLASADLVSAVEDGGQPSRVKRGMQIGRVGKKGDNGVDREGQPWAEHLHFELRRPGKVADPAAIDVGYSEHHPAHLEPTSATSSGNDPRSGFIDAHR